MQTYNLFLEKRKMALSKSGNYYYDIGSASHLAFIVQHYI